MHLLCSETATLRGISRCKHWVLTAGDVINPLRLPVEIEVQHSSGTGAVRD